MEFFDKITSSGSGIVLAQEYSEYKHVDQPSRESFTKTQSNRSSQEFPRVSKGIRVTHRGLSLLGSVPNRKFYAHGDSQVLPVQLEFVMPSKDYSDVKQQWMASQS